MAIIAKELVKHDKVLEFSSIYEDYLRKDTENKFWLVNTNKLIKLNDLATISNISGILMMFQKKS